MTFVSTSFVKITRHNKDVAIYDYGLRTKNRTNLTHVLYFFMKFNKYYIYIVIDCHLTQK